MFFIFEMMSYFAEHYFLSKTLKNSIRQITHIYDCDCKQTKWRRKHALIHYENVSSCDLKRFTNLSILRAFQFRKKWSLFKGCYNCQIAYNSLSIYSTENEKQISTAAAAADTTILVDLLIIEI